MIIETSAVVAMVADEPGTEWFHVAMHTPRRKLMSAASLLESGIVIDSRRNPVFSRRLDDFIAEYEVAIAPVTESQARIARQAYRDFGKGSGHKAQLNFGDCFAYALAHETGEPLLYKGDDFAATGIRAVVGESVG